MRSLNINPYDLPYIPRFAIALLSSLLTGLIATMLFQWQMVRATIDQPEQILTRVYDTDFDGLSDLDELNYGTRVYEADTDNDLVQDGAEVARGRNPNGEGPLPSQYTLLLKGPDRDHDNLSDTEEQKFGSDADNADSDGDGFSDGVETMNGYNPSGIGRAEVRVRIPTIRVDAPLVWAESNDEHALEQDLTRGIVRYPGTATPGESGNVFITGHSSDYLWQRGPYRDIFKKVPELSIGDEVIFRFIYSHGIVREVKYRLTEKMIVNPSDISLLAPSPTPILTLVTCYPVGTNSQRLAWRGVLVQN